MINKWLVYIHENVESVLSLVPLVKVVRSSNKSKPKRTVTPYTVCMSAQPLPIGASGMGIDITKVILLS